MFTDFDGTLAPLVPDPDGSRPTAGAAEALDELAGRFARVGVLSGRPVAFLQRHFRAGPLVLSGLYGLELVDGGGRRDHPAGERWRPVVEETAGRARAEGPAGARVEDKGLSLTLHYREHPEVRAEVERWVAAEASRTGLVAGAAKMSCELHPPIEADKGTALLDLAGGLDAVCFLADDRGDLPAFAALDRLGATGVTAVRVTVRAAETPPELLDRADLVVDGPEGATALLRSLLG